MGSDRIQLSNVPPNAPLPHKFFTRDSGLFRVIPAIFLKKRVFQPLHLDRWEPSNESPRIQVNWSQLELIKPKKEFFFVSSQKLARLSWEKVHSESTTDH